MHPPPSHHTHVCRGGQAGRCPRVSWMSHWQCLSEGCQMQRSPVLPATRTRVSGGSPDRPPRNKRAHVIRKTQTPDIMPFVWAWQGQEDGSEGDTRTTLVASVALFVQRALDKAWERTT